MNSLMHPLKETMPLAGVKTNVKQLGTGLDTETALATTCSTTQSMYTTQTAFPSSTTATMETFTFLAQPF